MSANSLPPCYDGCIHAARVELVSGQTLITCTKVGALPLAPHPLQANIFLPVVKSCSLYEKKPSRARSAKWALVTVKCTKCGSATAVPGEELCELCLANL